MRNASACGPVATVAGFFGTGGATRAGPSMPVALLAGAVGTAMAIADAVSEPNSEPTSDSVPDCMDEGARAVNKALCTCNAWSRKPGRANPMLTVTITAMPR
ncbi:hypothetical protein D3C73_1094700 [compost metagenome]